MRIDGLSQQPKVPQTRQRSTPVRPRQSGSVGGDSVEISAQPPSLDELSAQARAASIDNTAQLTAVRERVRSGYYDSPQVRAQIAERMLQADGMQEIVSDIGQAQVAREALTQVPDVRSERVEDVRQRVSSGHYDTPEIRAEIADRVLDELA